MNRMLCLAGLLALSATAQAGTCEQDFQAVGDPRNGLLFTGQVSKPGLSVSSALGQMQKIAADDGFEVGNESIVGNSGELFFTQTSSRPPIVVRVEADSSGQVSMGTKLARGQKMETRARTSAACWPASRPARKARRSPPPRAGRPAQAR